jgi:gliding motility-associated-like protein
MTYSVIYINDVCLNIPDAFSPNADGVNDTWQIEGIENFDNIHIQIFNRWGQPVFEFEGTGVEYSDPAVQWDGTFNDAEITTNSFIYMLDLLNGQETYNGIVTIIKD